MLFAFYFLVMARLINYELFKVVGGMYVCMYVCMYVQRTEEIHGVIYSLLQTNNHEEQIMVIALKTRWPDTKQNQYNTRFH